MQDSEYIFYSQQISTMIKKGVYVKVTANERDATFTIKFIGRDKEEAV